MGRVNIEHVAQRLLLRDLVNSEDDGEGQTYNMPPGVTPYRKVQAKEVSKHAAVDAMLQVAFSEPRVQPVNLQLSFGDACLVESVFIDIIRLVFVDNEK